MMKSLEKKFVHKSADGDYSDESDDDDDYIGKVLHRFNGIEKKKKKSKKEIFRAKNKTKADHRLRKRKMNRKWEKEGRYIVMRGYVAEDELGTINTDADAKAIHVAFSNRSKNPDNQAVTGTVVVCCVMQKEMADGGHAYKKFCFSNNGGAISVDLVIAAQKKGYQFIQTDAEHAEMSAIEYAKQKGHRIVRMGVSIPHCIDCTRAMGFYFGTIADFSETATSTTKFPKFNLSPFLKGLGVKAGMTTMDAEDQKLFKQGDLF